ncbi:TldD/PmbA family protein [Parapedobacter koreensis]|uniref:TldD protein n=1 Tax=Parapedobacter koreensis TaxID=332977 RepID=A0A1H7GSB5_9SPHI|nr:TldD/PmbA family protein [Parapedobacter koreensis]SEK39520.1 TldD protein [Parapedobacter koreensis]
MKRKDFLKLTGLSFGAYVLADLPAFAKVIDPQAALDRIDTSLKKELADVALNVAKSKGATYADVRIGRYLNQTIATQEKRVRGLQSTESYGVGIRVIADGCWGFAATDKVDKDNIAQATALAIAIAKGNARFMTEPVRLAPQKGIGEQTWATPIEKNPFEVPVGEKVELLLAANQSALDQGANFVTSNLFMINEQKYFASTDGSYVDQDVHRIWPTFTVTAIDRASGKFETRDSLSAPMGMGYEYLTPGSPYKIDGVPVTLYKDRYDILADAATAAQHAKEKIGAKSVDPGKYDLVLDPLHLGLTIHESVGHSTELDRVLGYEANYAGTSFLTLDKWESKNFNFGNELVNVVADRTQPGSLGAVGYDDEGVPAGKWDVIKDGILVNYQTIRDQAHILGLDASQGCCYADSWNSIQFQRMPNISLLPNKNSRKVADMIKNVEKGIYIVGRGSYSIDQQRYNFQFGGQLFYEINNGKIVGMLKDVAYQANTQEFWNAMADIADEDDYRLFGTFFDGKGQPSQVSAVSHGSSTAHFKGINVINTGRTI